MRGAATKGWTSSEIRSRAASTAQLTGEHLAAFDEWLAATADVPLMKLEILSLDVSPLQETIDAGRAELERGSGVFTIRGLPVGCRYSEAEAATIYWILGRMLGEPDVQNGDGERLVRVAQVDDRAGKLRGYYSNALSPLHCDPSEVVGLLCLRPALFGGDSLLASSLHVHDVLRAEHPDLLDELYRPFPWDWMGEGPPEAPPFFEAPVFREDDGLVSCRFIGAVLRTSQRHHEAPRLTASQVQAVMAFEAIASDQGSCHRFTLEPGDMQFLNNAITLHGRTAFEDDPADPRAQRSLLRLWLSPHGTWARRSWVTRAGIPVGPLRPA